MSTEPLIKLEDPPRRAPESDDESPRSATTAPPASGNTRPQLAEDFLRVNPNSQNPPPGAQVNGYTQAVPYGTVPGVQFVQMPVYNVWSDPNIRGQLVLVIERAQLTKNYGLTNMNPYCRVRVGHQLTKTNASSGAGKSPVWNQRFAMPLPVGIDVVYVEILDECMLQSDQMIGWACVPIPEELLVAGGEMPRKSYSLSGKQGPNLEGTVDVRFHFSLSKDLPKNHPPPQPMMYHAPSAQMMYYHPPLASPYMYGAGPYSGYGIQTMQTAGSTPVVVQNQNYPQNHSQQPAPPARPIISEADVQALKEMFPSMEEQVIRGVLENSSGNKDTAADMLLQMS